MDRKQWLTERKISTKHWRCVKCLVKNYIAYDGWDCERCKTTCEQERQDARIKLANLAPKVEVMEPLEEDIDAQWSNTSTSPITNYNGCDACQNTCWVPHGKEWVACQCQWQTYPVSMAAPNEKESSMPSSNTSDAFEVTERLQPRLRHYSQYLTPNQKPGTLNTQESGSFKSEQHPLGGKISEMLEKGHSLDRQGMVDGNENVGSPEMAEAQDDEWKELPVARAQTTSCGEKIFSNTAPELLADQLNAVESPSEKFLDDLFLEYGDQISSSPASSFTSHGSENTQSSSSSPPNISTPSTSSTSKCEARPKRVERNNEDENNSENRGYKRPKLGPTRGPHRGKIPGRRLACPFHIFDSEKYCKNSTTGTKYNTCSGPGFLEWHYLK
jgi:hypothetical protein